MNKPDKKYLKTLYKGLLTASIAQRIQVLSQALVWYDHAMEFVIVNKKVAPSRYKDLTKGAKLREDGISAKRLEDREYSFRMSVRCYERFCERLRATRVDKYYHMYSIKKKKLEAREYRLGEKHAFLIRLLTSSLSGSGLKIKVIDNAQKPRHHNGIGEFVYSSDHANKMRKTFRSEGLLALIVQELPFITRAMSAKQVGGGFVYDSKRQSEAYELMLRSFVKFCKTEDAPRRLLKRSEEEVTKGKKSKTRPRYTAGSCIEFLFNRLKDERPWTKKNLFKDAPSDPQSPLKRLIKHGSMYGEWEIKIAEDVVQLVKTK